MTFFWNTPKTRWHPRSNALLMAICLPFAVCAMLLIEPFMSMAESAQNGTNTVPKTQELPQLPLIPSASVAKLTQAFAALNGTAPSALNGTAPSALNGTAPSALNGTAPSALNGTAPSALNGTAPSALNDVPSFDPAWEPLLHRLEADGFSRKVTEPLFAKLGPKSYSPAYMAAKVTELHGVGGIGIKRKDEALPELPENYEQPLSSFTIGSCKEFMNEHKETLDSIREKHGVPAHVIVGLLLVETGLGTDLGKEVALRALASMAVTTTPELLGSAGNGAQPKRVRPASLATTLRGKSDWAYKEVKALIAYGEATGTDVSKMPASMYGAVGICQFMPTNISLYAVDGDNDGKIDLFSVVDAMYSVANYLESNGWRGATTPTGQFSVIRTYNHDNYYAAQVQGAANQLARALKGKVADSRDPLAGVSPVPARVLDPSLRRARHVPASARIKSLDSYENLLK